MGFWRIEVCVEDMLKSVASVLEAIALMKHVRGMCRAGGFRLTKFVSNSKEQLLPITQKDRWHEAPNKGLPETISDNERALRVLWNIEDDKPGFQVDMKENLWPDKECGHHWVQYMTHLGLQHHSS